jgi:hypothetical protein
VTPHVTHGGGEDTVKIQLKIPNLRLIDYINSNTNPNSLSHRVSQGLNPSIGGVSWGAAIRLNGLDLFLSNSGFSDGNESQAYE